MSALRVVASLTGLLLTAACSEPNHATASFAIVGGTPSTTDPEVYLLAVEGNNAARTTCTATLIAPSTLLTAAHCVDPSMLGASSVVIDAANAPTAAEVQWGVGSVRVTEVRLHPRWNAAVGLASDLALLWLATPQAVQPRPWSQTSLVGRSGRPVRALGYGAATADGGGTSGVKRTVELTLRQLTPELISLGNFVDRGICHGDSGGPTLLDFGDGVERLVGVHSFTRSDDCLDGAATRLDVNAPFLFQWLSDRENTCGADLVCSPNACTPNDPDCRALGEPCEHPFQCPGRACAADDQHPTPMCTRPCSLDAECGAGFACDQIKRVCQRPQLPSAKLGEPCVPGQTYCLAGGLCTAVGDQQPARCGRPCARTSDCGTTERCRTGAAGNVCTDATPIELPVAQVTLPAAPRGCSVSSGLGGTLALLVLGARRRTRKAAPARRNC